MLLFVLGFVLGMVGLPVCLGFALELVIWYERLLLRGQRRREE